MGMFLSQYSMLKAIGYGERGYLKDETEKILEPFKLFVLILHDPAKHVPFHQKFSELFARLDYLTGPNLLFMGITKPSFDWYNKNQNRDYFNIWEKENLIKSFHEIKTAEGSITAYSITKALNIDYDDLPCLVISSDYKNENFVVIKTGGEHIENQLKELGYFASSITDKTTNIYSENFNLLLHEINYYNQSEIVKHKEALGKSLADLFSFYVPENNFYGTDARLHSNMVINNLENIIIRAKETYEIENAKMILLTNLAHKFNNKNKPFKGLMNSRVSILDDDESYLPKCTPNKKLSTNNFLNSLSYLKKNSELLELESQIIVSTIDAVYKIFEEMAGHKILDFSPLVLGFSKIFEIETNLSIVHWVRKYLDIEMPDYYKRFKPSRETAFITPDKMIVPNPKPIDFNMHKGTKWIAPGLGQSELIIRSLQRKNILIESFSNTEELSLINAWSPIRESRNRAAHSEVMDVGDLDNVATKMNALIESNNLKKILYLKQQYNGNPGLLNNFNYSSDISIDKLS